jgi:hypothetical protein
LTGCLRGLGALPSAPFIQKASNLLSLLNIDEAQESNQSRADQINPKIPLDVTLGTVASRSCGSNHEALTGHKLRSDKDRKTRPLVILGIAGASLLQCQERRNLTMARFDVSVQRYRNAAVYIEANTEDEAKELARKKVGEMLQNGMFWGEEYYVITGAF